MIILCVYKKNQYSAGQIVVIYQESSKKVLVKNQ